MYGITVEGIHNGVEDLLEGDFLFVDELSGLVDEFDGKDGALRARAQWADEWAAEVADVHRRGARAVRRIEWAADAVEREFEAAFEAHVGGGR